MTAATLLRLADDYGRLPEFLSTDTAPKLDTMGRTGNRVHGPIPIRAEVSDLLAAIANRAVEWEAALRADFRMGPVYWTKPRPVAVPTSLRWSASILRDPPTWEDVDGIPHPGVVPDATAIWIVASAGALADQCSRIIESRLILPRTTCQRCDTATLFTHPVTRETRCTRCGVKAA